MDRDIRDETRTVNYRGFPMDVGSGYYCEGYVPSIYFNTKISYVRKTFPMGRDGDYREDFKMQEQWEEIMEEAIERATEEFKENFEIQVEDCHNAGIEELLESCPDDANVFDYAHEIGSRIYNRMSHNIAFHIQSALEGAFEDLREEQEREE